MLKLHLIAWACILCVYTPAMSMFQEDTVENVKDSTWDVSAILTLNIQQVGFTNWAQGGEPALSYGGVFNFSANKTETNYSWKNNLRFGYGVQKQNQMAPRKNNDLMILVSEYSHDISNNWQYSIGVDFRSQFAEGFKYSEDPNTGDEIATLVSDLFSPAYLQPSLGLTYKQGKNFTATLSPLSNKLTIVLNEDLSNQGAYGVLPGKNVRSQIGSSIILAYSKELMENINLKLNVLTFGDYKNLDVWDVNFDMLIDMKVNKWFSTNFLVQSIYDDDIRGNSEDSNISGPALQIRSVLNVGITFNLVQ